MHYARNRQAAQETVELIEKDGGRAFALGAELGVPGDIDQLFPGLEAGLKQHTGQTTLDILVNNAAETSTGTAPEEVSAEEFAKTFAVNVKAPFFITQRALGLIPDGGRVINISSGLTRVANPAQSVYSMTKGALEQLTLHLARHLAPGRSRSGDHGQQCAPRHHRQRERVLQDPRGPGADVRAVGVQAHRRAG
ncbi:SDR family NAD(P)-dependent oxidoreductase [Streptomyces coeruleorubidus]|uniref:SDR family NAD(P)-dependent oxidoreductase n=1 Tax=Streptomyces coeruleorubidus TaxID=116188 RepID=UPI003F4C95D1